MASVAELFARPHALRCHQLRRQVLCRVLWQRHSNLFLPHQHAIVQASEATRESEAVLKLASCPIREEEVNLYPRCGSMIKNSSVICHHRKLILEKLMQRAHLQMTLWKAADQHSPPDIDISNFGWEMKAGVLSPCIDHGPTGPPTPWTLSVAAVVLQGKHVWRSAAVRRTVSPARFTAYMSIRGRMLRSPQEVAASG